jgi:hypothetical protein
MIILNSLSGASDVCFGGIVEADETYQRESHKGTREWALHLQNPSRYRKPPRRRRYEYVKKGIPMMWGLTRWQLPILTVADRNGSRRFQRISGRSKGTIQMALSPIVARDAVLCSDGLAGYAAFAQSCGIKHFIIKSEPGQKAASATHNIQNINSLHSLYKEFMRLFRGPASKYLDGYLQ